MKWRSALILTLLLAASAVAVMAAQEVIVDNPAAAFAGTWTTQSSATDKYGADYRYASQTTSGSATATYTPSIPSTASDWQVYTWFPTVSTASRGTRFIVHHALGDSTVTIPQDSNRGAWVAVGTYTMNAGTANYVRITNYHASQTRRAIADAVRFYSPSAGDLTPPVISNVQSVPGTNSAVITWTTNEAATSQVEYGLTAAYGSQTVKDTGLVTSHSVTVTGLTASTPYHFRVKSDDGAGNAAVSGDYMFTTTAPIPEYRAIWADTWHNGFLSDAETTNLVNTLAGANYNCLIAEVRKSGDAYYNSAYEPWATNISPGGGAYDPLADLITKCHAQNIQLHAWFVAYRIWRTNWGAPPANHVWTLHPEWAMKDTGGGIVEGTYNYLLDPGVPGVQDYVCKVVIDCLTKYPGIDGINFDYIRYPGIAWGYNELTKQRFAAEYGFQPPTSDNGAQWTTWNNFRRQQVTDLMKKIYLEAMYVKPTINVSVDTVAWMGANPNTNFEGTAQYAQVFQSGKQWMLDHIVDTTFQMNYKREHLTDQQADYRLWSQYMANLGAASGRHAVDGNAAYLNTIGNTVIQMQYDRSIGNDGMCNYSYAVPESTSPPDPAAFYSTIRDQVYPGPVPVPELTWKTQPTTGVIFGTITDAAMPNDPIYQNWIYKAAVTVSGPVTLNTLTDATGTYGFLDLPPGTYTVTISKTGFPTKVISGVSISAGQVARRDAALGETTVTVTSPAGVVVNGWSLFSLPNVPVDSDPAVIMSGIDIDGKLTRWDKVLQGTFVYDMWSPEQFGGMDVDNGYWLESFAPGTISYTGQPNTNAPREIALPVAGWAIIGCPFTSDRQWAGTTVRHGAQTVPILTAAHDNGWMNSVGYWWDSSVQGLSDFGLPEDFVSSDILQPWHGYWVETFVDDLTLTLQ